MKFRKVNHRYQIDMIFHGLHESDHKIVEADVNMRNKLKICIFQPFL